MLRIIKEDADSFAQRAEMYYKKKPQLISLVEDFYQTHRSLAIQFDHLRHDPCIHRTSPLVRSFSFSTGQSEKPIDLHKSCDERTKSMLRIIEEAAGSLAQRAEMYYKKRPQLISLVEDFKSMNLIDLAQSVFDQMIVRNSVSWNALINGYVKVGDLASVRNLFNKI